MPLSRKRTAKRGFSFVETLVGITLIAVVGISLFALFQFSLNVIWESKAQVTASALANQKIEEAHNLPYANVGTIGGIPSGTLPQSTSITRNGIVYTVQTTAVYVDDPFDGTLGGSPNDTVNTDYKRVGIQVSWPYRLGHKPVEFVTDIMPKGIEGSTGGGTIKISVFNANALPVSAANVHIVNIAVTPQIDITPVTDANGLIILPGATPSIESYQVTVTKNGYSQDQTYASSPQLPSPSKPLLTVLANQLTERSFTIDRTSELLVQSVLASATATTTGAEPPLAAIAFTLKGGKTVGTDLNGQPILKYNQNHTTSATGTIQISGLEWDSYTPSVNSQAVGYDIAFIHPKEPIVLLPNTAATTTIGLVADAPDTLRVMVADTSGQPIEGALVRLSKPSPLPSDQTRTTLLHGQVFFTPLTSASYTLEITKIDYWPYSSLVIVNGDTVATMPLTPTTNPPPPPAPPTAPSHLAFSSITKTSMILNWTDNASNEDGYRIYQNTVNTKPQAAIVALPAQSTVYSATGLSCGTTVYWWVEAYNTGGSSETTASQSTSACSGIVFSDAFTEGSNTVLSSHTPDQGSGWTRLIQNGGSDIRIGVHGSSDTLQRNGWCSKSQGVLYQTNDVMSGSDYEVSIQQVVGDDNDNPNVLAARIQNANNLYALEWHEEWGILWKRVAGTWSSIGTLPSGIANGSIVMLKVQGAALSVKDDGVTVLSVVDGSHANAGRAGIGMGGVITPAHSSYDCEQQKLDTFRVNVTN